MEKFRCLGLETKEGRGTESPRDRGREALNHEEEFALLLFLGKGSVLRNFPIECPKKGGKN